MTIEVPTPSADLVAQIETATLETADSETAAIAAIRTRFAPYAKHNGYVRIAHYEASTANWSIDRSAYYKDAAGKRAKALLVCDGFTTGRENQNNGTLGGNRLYLLATGEWLELKRDGLWSAWQGSPSHWGCGEYAAPDTYRHDEDSRELARNGYTKILTDAEVAADWSIEDLLSDLGKTMAEMCAKLPERHGRLKARAALAQQIIQALA